MPVAQGLQQSLTAAAAASSAGPARRIQFTVRQGPPRPVNHSKYKYVPLRVLPLPPLPTQPVPLPTTNDIIIMRAYNAAASEAQVKETFFDNTFNYILPMNRTFPSFPQSVYTMLGTYSSSMLVTDPSALKFNSLVYMKNELSTWFNNPEIIAGVRLDDLIFVWGTDEDEATIKQLEIIVSHKNYHEFNKSEIAFLRHVIDFIPFYYQIIKYKNKLWQRQLQVMKQILAQAEVPEFKLKGPYPAALVSAISKIDLLQGRILMENSIEKDFRLGIVYRLRYKPSAMFTENESKVFDDFIRKLSIQYLFKTYLEIGDFKEQITAGGMRRRRRTNRRSRK